MYNIIKPYLLSFIPIFVAINVFGILPIFIGLTTNVTKEEKHKIVVDSVITATTIALSFIFVGKIVFYIMGISVADFKIAGGILLLILSVHLLLPGESPREKQHADVGIFPLGTPLITGPAVLTTTLVLMDAYGVMATFISLVINMFMVWLVLTRSEKFAQTIGINGMRAFSKVGDILLTAIAVMMIRKGLLEIFQLFR